MQWRDWAQAVRRSVIPVLGRLTAEVNDSLGTDFYVETVTYHRELVGFVDMSVEECEDFLVNDLDFEYNELSSWKTLRGTDLTERTSLAWRGTVDDGSFVHDPWADKQLHVILYNVDGETAVFAHWEYSWRTHPIKHYRGKEATAEEGVELMRQLFRDHDVDVFGEQHFLTA